MAKVSLWRAKCVDSEDTLGNSDFIKFYYILMNKKESSNIGRNQESRNAKTFPAHGRIADGNRKKSKRVNKPKLPLTPSRSQK